MALITCHECKSDVSTDAKNCPKCGAKVKKPTSKLTWAVLGVIVFAIVMSAINKPPPAPPKTAEEVAAEKVANDRLATTAAALRMIKSGAREPDSIEWVDILSNDDASLICIRFKGKNGFGGVSIQEVAFVKSILKKEDAAWNTHCAGKSLLNMKAARHAI